MSSVRRSYFTSVSVKRRPNDDAEVTVAGWPCRVGDVADVGLVRVARDDHVDRRVEVAAIGRMASRRSSCRPCRR